jgi:hypothetical protein
MIKWWFNLDKKSWHYMLNCGIQMNLLIEIHATSFTPPLSGHCIEVMPICRGEGLLEKVVYTHV